jgi:hypothetical protein
VLLAAAVPLTACRDNAAPAIRIDVGPAPTDEATLVPLASLAELIELSPTESALLITLSSTARTCEAPTPGEPEAAAVALRVVLPGGAKLEPGTFPLVAAGTGEDKPHVLATVKLNGRRRELGPGGELTITHVEPSPRGSLEGLLKLEFTGDAEHVATRISGRFLAHFCRISLLR